MSRGYILEVTTDIENIGFLDETDLYDMHNALSVDYFKDLGTEEEKEQRTAFLQEFLQAGAETGMEIRDDGEQRVIPFVVMTEDVKRNYFRERLTRLKEYAASITLDQFAEIDNHDLTLYHLKNAISDDYGDMVFLNSCCYTVDDFIRNSEPGTKYYLGNVVFMH